MGGKPSGIGGSPHPVYQMREVWDSGTTLAPWELTLRVRKFRLGEEYRSIRTTLQHFFEAIRFSISVNSYPLEPVIDFPHLGLTVTYNNSYWVSLYQNLQKVQQRW